MHSLFHHKTDCLVVIPAFNEEKNIARVVRQAKDQGIDVLVVDDGSADGTVQCAKAEKAEVLTSESNHGKGAALMRGIQYFLSKHYKCLIMMDADGQHDPLEIPYFVRFLQEHDADIVVGNRMGDAAGMPWIRRVTNIVMSGLISFITRQRIEDTQCGYRAVKRRVLEKITLNSAHFEIESEILLKAARMGFKIRSIPVRCVYQGQDSHIRPVKDTLRFFSFLFKYFFS